MRTALGSIAGAAMAALALAGPGTGALAADFTDFYPVAERTILNPPKLDSLSVLCAKTTPGGGHYSFVGKRGGKALLMVLTNERIKSLKKTIQLEVKILVTPQGFFPTARPLPGGSLDWAYLYDRNGDGRIDYLSYLYSAQPYKPDNFPPEFPKARDGKLSIDSKDPRRKEYLVMVIRNSRMIFSHHADDNFDGATDAAIASYHDSLRPIWVEEFGVVRSTRMDGNADETWTFRHDIRQRTGKVPTSKGKLLLQNDQPPQNRRSGAEWLDFGYRLMRQANDFAAECGLGKGDFPPG